MVWLWIGFVVFILVMLALDLGVFHRKAEAFSMREALTWTCVVVAMALLFNVAIYFMYEHHWLGIGLTFGHELSGKEAAKQFLAGYIIEQSLSVDNLFVMAVIFNYFHVPLRYQHRVLFWGILGALVMRGIMIGTGAVLINAFSWTTYVFGALLLATAVKMLLAGDEPPDPNLNWLTRAARKIFPVADQFDGERFFTRIPVIPAPGEPPADPPRTRLAITRLMLVLLVVESTDVVFAVDSIPAIFSVTRDPFIVFTSNVFAILGLRSLFFVLAGMMEKFRYLKASLVFVLTFVGVKMLIEHHYPIDTGVSLAVVLGILLVGVVASLLAPPHPPQREDAGPDLVNMEEEKNTTPEDLR